jgi:hypothetical protein
MHPNQDNVVSFHPDRSLDNLPPQNIEAEVAILGGIMLDPEAITRVSDRLVGITVPKRENCTLRLKPVLHKHFSDTYFP